MLHTSYFAKVRTFPSTLTPIGISLWPPHWFTGESYPLLSPSRDLLNAYKAGGCTQAEYRFRYYDETLSRLDPASVYKDLCAKGEDVAILCYERTGEFCHRRLVAEWLEKTIGVIVPEYDPSSYSSDSKSSDHLTTKGAKEPSDIGFKPIPVSGVNPMPDTYKTRLGNAWEEQLDPSWKILLADIWANPKFRDLALLLDLEYTHHDILPEQSLIFNALHLTPFDDVNVVILGQDPYPDPLYPHGLAFSVRPGVRLPLSLRNIFKELQDDLGGPLRSVGSLIDWAQQGVLLLNTSLTVRSNEPGSHANRGWEEFTDRVIRVLSEQKNNLVFVLWGSHAIRKAELIDKTRHLVLCSSHPSFRSADKPCGDYPPFRNSRPFSQINAYLAKNNLDEIKWANLNEGHAGMPA